MGRYKRVCNLCGAEKPEFTVTSKHLGFVLKELKEFDSLETDHITRHICTDCFLKIFKKQEENPTIEQNAGENRIEGGVLSVSGSVSEKHYRPFKDCDELVETYHKRTFTPVVVEELYNKKLKKMYRPEIWVKSKAYGTENLITAFDNDNESIGGSCVYIQDIWIDMKELFDCFTFLDGSVCGKPEK